MIPKESGLIGAAEIALEVTQRSRFSVASVALSMVSSDIRVKRGMLVSSYTL
jgi:hypothetical protein